MLNGAHCHMREQQYRRGDRQLVKPGMTGLAQMRGYHGTIANKQDLYNRCLADIEYIQNWSLFGDLSIFFGTMLQVAKKIFWKG